MQYTKINTIRLFFFINYLAYCIAKKKYISKSVLSDTVRSSGFMDLYTFSFMSRSQMCSTATLAEIIPHTLP